MKYRIIVNGEPRKDSPNIYEFDYGSVRHIKLKLSMRKLSIELQMKSEKSVDEFFTEKNNCFSESLKKGMLFHLLLYSKPLPTNNIRIYIDDKEVPFLYSVKSPVIYSLILEDLKYPMSSEWKDAYPVFRYFCQNHKSYQKDLAASLYALLYSKSKDNYTERFLYLWISMNGLYNHLAKMKNSKIRRENEKITVLEKVEEWGTGCIIRKDLGELAYIVENAFTTYGFGTEKFYEVLRMELLKFPPDKPAYDIILDGYLNLWYPYYLRCNLFHANRPIALFALANEFEIRRLEFVNERLDSYLSHNLWKYFDEDYCKEKIDNIS